MDHGTDWIDLLSDERQFLENLLNTRANFNLVVFGLAFAAAGVLETVWLQFAVLAASTLLSALLAFTIGRAQYKLDLVIRELPGDHPANHIDRLADREALTLRGWKRLVALKSRRQLIGYRVPLITTLLLLAGTIMAPLGVFQSPTELETASVRAELKELRLELNALRDSVFSLHSQAAMASSRSPF